MENILTQDFFSTLSSLCTHHIVAQGVARRVCIKHVHPHVITCLSVCCFLVLSSSSVSRALYFLSHFYLFSVLNFNFMRSSTPSIKPNAHPQNQEYCLVAIYNPPHILEDGKDVLFLRVHGSTPLRTVQGHRHVGGELTATGAMARDVARCAAKGTAAVSALARAGAGREALPPETQDGILPEPRAKRLTQRSGELGRSCQTRTWRNWRACGCGFCGWRRD